MPNRRVASDKRKRVAKACNNCRTRKQKCDGHQPCKNCRKRSSDCEYRPSISTYSSSNSNASCSPPRHGLGEQTPEAAEDSDMSGISKTATSQYRTRSTSPGTLSSFCILSTARPDEFGKITYSPMASDSQQRSQTIVTLHLPLLTSSAFSGCCTTESFVALIKQHVKRGSGSSSFTKSGIWYYEPQETRPISPCPLWPPSLPRYDIERLVDLYFTHMLDFVDVVTYESVKTTLCQGPSHENNSDRCLVYLILAIGLAFDSYPRERGLQDPNLKELFFANAEALLPPIENGRGLEKDVPWTLQALILMSFYMLCVSRPHTARSYCVRAIEVAYAFGIHQGKETEIDDSPSTRAWRVSRRNAWRGLFVLDRFIAATLGRPLIIHQRTEESLKAQKSTSLSAAVDACRIIGETIKALYSESRTPMEKVKSTVGHLDSLIRAERKQAPFMAQGHIRSLRIYADILLCRPFFLLRFMSSAAEREILDCNEPQINELSQRCVSESIQAVYMVKEGTSSAFSPLHIDPFVTYALTEAVYVLLCSIYADIHVGEENLSLANDAIDILMTADETNSYAKHSASVLASFLHDVKCRVNARIIKPKLEKHAYRTKTEPNMAYESSQYRSPFPPVTQSSSSRPHDNHRRAAVDDHTTIKKESHTPPSAFASMSFPSHSYNGPFHQQSLPEYLQHPWHNEHSDMDFDRSQRG